MELCRHCNQSEAVIYKWCLNCAKKMSEDMIARIEKHEKYINNVCSCCGKRLENEVTKMLRPPVLDEDSDFDFEYPYDKKCDNCWLKILEDNLDHQTREYEEFKEKVLVKELAGLNENSKN